MNTNTDPKTQDNSPCSSDDEYEDNDYKYGTIIVSPSHASDNVLDSLRNYINNKENPLIQFFEIRHLQLNISKHVKVPKHRIVDEKEIHNKLDELIDVIRIDVDVADPDSTMKWILDNGSNNLIVIVDDTVEISRVMMMQEQIELGNLKLLWWGINSAAWCRTDLNSDNILNSIVETPVEHFKQFQIRDQKFMGRNNKFLITWPTGTFHELLR
jgi:hypothetical protein